VCNLVVLRQLFINLFVIIEMGEVNKEVLDKLEAGFAKLQQAGEGKSLLKKYLTKQTFDALKGKCVIVLR